MTLRLTPGVSPDVVGPDVGDAVADALGRVPRHVFVPDDRRMTAYLDRSVPIGRGRRCPQPSLVARMLDACAPVAGRVLVIGAGTGYVAACAAELATEVVAVEGDEALLALAAAALGEIGANGGGANAVVLRQAVPRTASLEVRPFDAILVCGALPRTPRGLLAGLSDLGTLIVPIASDAGPRLFSFRRAQRGHIRRDLGPADVEMLPKPESSAC